MEQYIQQLLRDQGVSDSLDPETRQELVADLSERATDFMNRRLIDALSDEAVAEFESLVDAQGTTPEQIQGFIQSHVTNYEKVVALALTEFRALYLGEKA